MEMEGKPKPLLFVATPQRLFAIDMSKLKVSHYESPNFDVLLLPLFNMLNLAGEGFSLWNVLLHKRLQTVHGRR